MPGAGKSTIGIILAKNLGFGFIDTDVLIQMRQKKTLQEIINERGHLALRAIEEEEIVKIHTENHIIATGGSAVHSEKAMSHLSSISTIIFLEVDFEKIKKRILNFETRGIAKAVYQTFNDLFRERHILYQKHADITINCNKFYQDELAVTIQKSIK